MEKKLKIKIIRVILIIGVLSISYKIFLNSQEKALQLIDYMPTKPMVKIFGGSYEGSGSIDIIDKVTKNSYQKKTLNTGSMGVAIYSVTDDKYKLIYRESEIPTFEEDYLGKKDNFDLTLLRTPIKKGVSWSNNDGSIYKIISVDEKTDILGKEVNTIKLRYRKEGYEYYLYFAKGFGVVKVETEMGDSELFDVKYDIKEYLN